MSRIQIETIDKDQAKNGIKFDPPKPKEEGEEEESKGNEENEKEKETELPEGNPDKKPELNSGDNNAKEKVIRKSEFLAQNYQLQKIAEKIRDRIAGRFTVPREI